MPPAALLLGLGEHLAQRRSRTQRAVAHREHRGAHTAALGSRGAGAAQDSEDSPEPGSARRDTLVPSTRTPIITSRHTLSGSSRTLT